MPKTKGISELEAAATAQEENSTPTMDTQIITTTSDTATAALPVPGKALLTSNATKTSYRFTWMRDGRQWNEQEDLSLLDNIQAHAGLNGIARYVAGDVKGTPTFIQVAPEDKLERELGTGVFAYVNAKHDPGDPVVFDVNGNTLNVFIDENDIPRDGWWRLKLDAGQLYHDARDPQITVRGERGGWLNTADPRTDSYQKHYQDTWQYWRLRALSAILSGRNVSVSVAPWNLEKAQAVADVCNSPDPKAANDLRLFLNRRTRRDVQEATETTVTILGETDGGKNIPQRDDMFIVPTTDGGTISLKGWPKGRALTWVDENGLGGDKPRRLKVGDDAELLGIAMMIRNNNYKLRLS